MATRSIVTSQPDVTCFVCDRRLLRGEHPETFLADGQRRTVCELCAPRATHQGWLRETGSPSVSLPPERPRRGRNLFDRLRQAGRPAGAPEAAAASRSRARRSAVHEAQDDASAISDEPVVPARGEADAAGPPVPEGAGAPDRGEVTHASAEIVGADLDEAGAHTVWPRPGGLVERAVEMFNAGEHPRRVAGVARSLGVPGVSVRPDKDFGSLVSIVIAWELCWYRYAVDVDDEDAGARVLAQGTELSELPREDRIVNAVVDELGALSLAPA
jgi:hypothetical protein